MVEAPLPSVSEGDLSKEADEGISDSDCYAEVLG